MVKKACLSISLPAVLKIPSSKIQVGQPEQSKLILGLTEFEGSKTQFLSRIKSILEFGTLLLDFTSRNWLLDK